MPESAFVANMVIYYSALSIYWGDLPRWGKAPHTSALYTTLNGLRAALKNSNTLK